MTRKEVRDRISQRLRDAGIESYQYESFELLSWKLGLDRSDFYLEPDREVDSKQLEELEKVVLRREAREPLQYLMHSCEFMGYPFYVDENVLIPRQDTECLVEDAVEKIRQTKESRVLDLCTGSGCIGISIALLCPNSQVVLTDVSEGALQVAKRNAQSLKAEVTFLQGDVFSGCDTLPETERRFDVIVSNPPYIPTKVVEGLMPEVRDHEPHLALDGLEDGLYFYRRIIREAVNYLKPEGWLLFEIGAEQGEDLSRLLKEGGFSAVQIKKDLPGLDRIAIGRLS